MNFRILCASVLISLKKKMKKIKQTNLKQEYVSTVTHWHDFFEKVKFKSVSKF